MKLTHYVLAGLMAMPSLGFAETRAPVGDGPTLTAEQVVAALDSLEFEDVVSVKEQLEAELIFKEALVYGIESSQGLKDTVGINPKGVVGKTVVSVFGVAASSALTFFGMKAGLKIVDFFTPDATGKKAWKRQYKANQAALKAAKREVREFKKTASKGAGVPTKLADSLSKAQAGVRDQLIMKPGYGYNVGRVMRGVGKLAVVAGALTFHAYVTESVVMIVMPENVAPQLASLKADIVELEKQIDAMENAQ